MFETTRRGFFGFIAGAVALAAVPFNRVGSYAFRVTHANTGASTLSMGGYGAKTLYKSDGTPLQAGDISGGEVVTIDIDWCKCGSPGMPHLHARKLDA